MKLIPLGSRIVVEPEKPKDRTDGGILLPDKAQKVPQVGKVLAVGPDWEGDVKPGNRVLFEQYTGADVKDGDRTYKILEDKFVLAVVEG